MFNSSTELHQDSFIILRVIQRTKLDEPNYLTFFFSLLQKR